MPPLRDSPIDFVREGSYIPVFPFSVSIIIARVFQKIFPTFSQPEIWDFLENNFIFLGFFVIFIKKEIKKFKKVFHRGCRK